jgi:hypothetical protein
VNTQATDAIPAERPIISKQLGFFRGFRKKTGWYLEYLWHLTESLRACRCNAIWLEGEERITGETVRVFYFGHGENYEFILKRIYAEYRTISIKKNILAFNIKKWVRKSTEGVDLIFCDVALLYTLMLPREEYLEIPHWIRQRYTVPDTWEAVLQSFRKNTRKTDLRKVRKYKFSYTISTAEEDYKSFYHTMHVPYLRKRFDDLVIIEPEWKFLRQCRKGHLMQIIRDGEVVAAVLLHMADGRLAYVWVGVPENIEGDMFNGAFSALYYYTILHGYMNGCHEIDFLGTRPVLNDGLFRYKRKWGTHVQTSPVPRGDMLLKPLRLSAPVKRFFANTFFITKDKKNNKLNGKILVDSHQVTKDDIQELINNYRTDGLNKLYIYFCDGFNANQSQWIESNFSDVKLVDLALISNPADGFCRA